VNAVAIAPDGRTAVTGSGDRTIMVWDLTGTGSET
jgi:WD40 repeat protein